MGCLFFGLFDSAPPRASILIRNFQEILYYCVTKQFLPCLNWLVMCFKSQNMLWKNVNCFHFWWKTYTKSFTDNYVISLVKRFYFPALCGWSGAFNFTVWFGKRKNAVCKQNYCIKNMVVKMAMSIPRKPQKLRIPRKFSLPSQTKYSPPIISPSRPPNPPLSMVLTLI